MCLRMKLFDETNRKFTNSNFYINGFVVGALVQYMTTPLFKLNLANHNYNFGDSTSFSLFFKQIRDTCSEGRTQFFLKSPLSLIVRGGIVGTIQLGIYKELVGIIDRPSLQTGRIQEKP